MQELKRVVVVGGSLAGLRACEAFRQRDFDGEVVLIGAERHRPYDRPPLSKKVLAGEWDLERIQLRKHEELDKLAITERLGDPAVGLDVDAGHVELASGERVGFDGVVVATGSRPRRLPGQPGRAYLLREIDDSLRLRDDLAPGDRRVVIVGAGFIGLEVAATARRTGNEVTVLEVAPAPLVRGLGPRIGQAIGDLHIAAGVDLRCGVSVSAMTDDHVELGDGERVPYDVLVVGVGAEPVTDWLAGSGLTIDNGVIVDETLSAGPPFVYAAGDVARWPSHLYGGELLRVEHWTNAAEQGAHAATNLLAEAAGEERPRYETVPFVWSDQYDHRIQCLGHASADDHVEVAVGSVDDHAFVALYERDGNLRAVAGLNRPRLVMPYRKLLIEGATWEQACDFAAEQRDKLAAS